jgi:hypothetical protein
VLAALLGMVNHTPQWYQLRGRLTPEDVADGYLMLVLSPALGPHLVPAREGQTRA